MVEKREKEFRGHFSARENFLPLRDGELLAENEQKAGEGLKIREGDAVAGSLDGAPVISVERRRAEDIF